MEIYKKFLGFHIKTSVTILLFLFCFQISWVYGGETIRLLSFQGQLAYKTSGGKIWQKVSGEVHLQPGDVLRTGAQSKAELEFQGGVIRMYENTILELPKEVKQEAKKRISKKTMTQLMKGRTIFKIIKDSLERPFEVVTPSLIAGVKGTIFKVIEEGQVKSVEVFEGLVEVSNRERLEERVSVGKGQRTLIENGRFRNPLPFEGRQGWEDWDSINFIQTARDSKRDAPEIPHTSIKDLGELKKERFFDQRLMDQENERLSDLLENSLEFRREIQTGSSKIPALTDIEKERAIKDSNFISTQGTTNVIDSSEDLTGIALPNLLP